MDSLDSTTTAKDGSVLPTTGDNAIESSTMSTDLPNTSTANDEASKSTATSKDPAAPTTSEYTPARMYTGPQTSRQNQWFVLANGISREVITADIHRYLGPDALVRPGTGTGDYHGEVGFWITAYRSLTSQMIQDLKQDSQRWAMERQPDQAGRHSGVAYQDSQTHAARQHWGPTTPFEQSQERDRSVCYDDGRELKGRQSYATGTGYVSRGYYDAAPMPYTQYRTTSGYGSCYPGSATTAAPGYYIASDGRQYPLQQAQTTTRASRDKLVMGTR